MSKLIKQCAPVSEAMGTLAKALDRDVGVFLAWQSKIAENMVIAENQYKKRWSKTTLNKQDRMIIANNGAMDFLNEFIIQHKTKRNKE